MVKKVKIKVKCKFNGCDNIFYSKGFCKRHYHISYSKTKKAKEKKLERDRKYVHTKRGYLSNKLCHARGRAKNLGLPFSVTLREILTISPEICPVFKTKLIYKPQERGPLNSFHIPSIDRIDPDKGYVNGNIQIISWTANKMKNDSSAIRLRQFSLWVLGGIGQSTKDSKIEVITSVLSGYLLALSASQWILMPLLGIPMEHIPVWKNVILTGCLAVLSTSRGILFRRFFDYWMRLKAEGNKLWDELKKKWGKFIQWMNTIIKWMTGNS